MKVAVTAVSGQLGSAIAQQLISKIGNENVVGTAFKAAAGRSHIRWEDYFNTLKQS